jgi:hypothetical protein
MVQEKSSVCIVTALADMAVIPVSRALNATGLENNGVGNVEGPDRPNPPTSNNLVCLML